MNIRVSEPYLTYKAWKGWGPTQFLNCSEYEFHYFRKEFSTYAFRDRNVLEIGFGNGEFLAFAKSRGALLWGTEVIPELCELARLQGVTVLDLDLSDAAPEVVGRFDLIVAFDVFEHIAFDDLLVLLKRCALLLAPGGQLIARFPNGQSPFGRFYQHGDHTHRAWLSASIFEHLCTELPFEFAGASRPRSPIFGPFGKNVGRRLKLATQQALEWFIGKTYAIRVPLSPNVVVRLVRR
jgi:SAM-dependent methyltransferase